MPRYNESEIWGAYTDSKSTPDKKSDDSGVKKEVKKAVNEQQGDRSEKIMNMPLSKFLALIQRDDEELYYALEEYLEEYEFQLGQSSKSTWEYPPRPKEEGESSAEEQGMEY